jgi:hypothetical protein
MLTLGNVHTVVPKGTKTGLNGDSVQPTGMAGDCPFGSFPKSELDSSFAAASHLDARK